MKKQETVLICDVCKNRVTDNGECQIGGSPFQGWMKLSRINGRTDLTSLAARKDWDLCSARCLSQLCENVLVDELANSIPGAENLTEEFKKSTELIFKNQ